MSPGKHGPNQLSRYVRIHNTVLDRYVREGFVRPDHDLTFEAVPEGLLVEGRLACAGGLTIQVRKLLKIIQQSPETIVQTRWYSYNVSVRGLGNLFRYDSPFLPDQEGHHRHDHVHRYDILAGDRTGTVTQIHEEDDVPTLGEVIEEAQRWHFEHMDELREAGDS